MKTIKNNHPRNIIGNTPLHFAAEKSHVKVCMLILQGVKNKNPQNHDGKTPLGKTINSKSVGYICT